MGCVHVRAARSVAFLTFLVCCVQDVFTFELSSVPVARDVALRFFIFEKTVSVDAVKFSNCTLSKVWFGREGGREGGMKAKRGRERGEGYRQTYRERERQTDRVS